MAWYERYLVTPNTVALRTVFIRARFELNFPALLISVSSLAASNSTIIATPFPILWTVVCIVCMFVSFLGLWCLATSPNLIFSDNPPGNTHLVALMNNYRPFRENTWGVLQPHCQADSLRLKVCSTNPPS